MYAAAAAIGNKIKRQNQELRYTEKHWIRGYCSRNDKKQMELRSTTYRRKMDKGVILNNTGGQRKQGRPWSEMT